MKQDSVDIDGCEEHHLECEAVRTALADALLRSRHGNMRNPGRTVLSSLESQWVSDVARMLVGEGNSQVQARQKTERKRMRFLRIITKGFARIFGRRRDRVAASDAGTQESEYVPVSCAAQGAVLDMSNDGCSGESVAPISTGNPVGR
jgi:hypothetical protein